MSPARRPGRSLLAAGTLVCGALTLAVSVVDPLGAQQPERRTLQGERVAIYNLVGALRAEPTTGSEVVVEITRRGADADRIVIERLQRGGAEVLALAYPGDRIRYRGSGFRQNTAMSVREDGTFGGGMGGGGRRVRIGGDDGLDASADLRVFVPRGQRIALHLGLGNVTVANVNGDILVDVGAA
ncbi:MAG TPA: hypothetical protein VMM18_11455, partial [Gemmatimonadaceae bacterium]|nr:hypothetical protein [Gemmatimonadaceae bacterium]